MNKKIKKICFFVVIIVGLLIFPLLNNLSDSFIKSSKNIIKSSVVYAESDSEDSNGSDTSNGSNSSDNSEPQTVPDTTPDNTPSTGTDYESSEESEE